MYKMFMEIQTSVEGGRGMGTAKEKASRACQPT